jgi:hypothetical protein
MAIYEAGLCTPPATGDPIPSYKRLELLCACLEAAKSYVEVFFSIPPASKQTRFLNSSFPDLERIGFISRTTNSETNF